MKVFKHLTANAIHLTPCDFSRELQMEAYLIDNPNVLSLDSIAYSDIDIIEDELTLKSGRASKSTDGRIDLVGFYESSNTLGLIELKKGTVGPENLAQLKDYLTERNQILAKINVEYPEITSPNWIGILAGTSIDRDLMKFVEDEGAIDINGEQVPLAVLTIKRFKSNDGQFFIMTETYFNDKSSRKNFDKYVFNDEEYGKGRLVLAVIQKFVQDNSPITFAKLKSYFPDQLLRSWGVFVTLEEAEEKNSSGHKRYFSKPDELIQLSDSVIAVSSQWGAANMQPILDQFKKLGIKINVKN